MKGTTFITVKGKEGIHRLRKKDREGISLVGIIRLLHQKRA